MDNHHWLHYVRYEWLTEFFLFFPLAASPFFYISVIAIGYWLRPGGKTFLHLGFLVPFFTVIGVILKNTFKIVRPELTLHLIEVNEAYGFPSGDVLVSTIFWGILYNRTANQLIKILSVLMIVMIACSRIYLGVHYISDVVGGLFFGLAAIALWRSNFVQNQVSSWYLGYNKSYWFVVLLASLLYFMSTKELFIPHIIVAIGFLIGYGCSFNLIWKWQDIGGIHSVSHFIAIALAYTMIVLMSLGIPLIEYNEYTKVISGILEFALLAFLIFGFFPRFIIKMIGKELTKKSN